MFRSFLIYIYALFGFILWPEVGLAQSFDAQSKHCNNPEASSALRIEACGWLIHSGDLPDKGYGIVYRLRALAYIDDGDREAAVADLTQAIAYDPKRVSNYLDRASAYRDLENYDLALEDYNSAIFRNPRNADAYYYRAGIFSDRDQLDMAIMDYRAAVRLNPDDSYALNSLAWLLAINPDRTARKGKEAIGFAKRAVELDPGDYEIWDTLAASYVEDGQPEKALKAYLKAQDLGGQERIESDQSWLSENGYYSGPVDGITNEATTAALKACIASGCQMYSEYY
ncbi:peptidoglycan-binding domain-containing protein [Kiloniella sp. EL199]|uniref:peptidoglycan-binding domain-containing protein n=1 Tax=Kiloniella sp. EL199 TaxID=2107581 RepID=UPI0013C4AFF4|nr:peptidoglycan-binding domain-containing protein [Kiloniella sp. EL199]